VTELPLCSGARADVAISCSGAGTATFASQSLATNNQPYYVGTVLTVNVVDISLTATTLPSFTVKRPCYASNTQTLTPTTTLTDFAMTGQGGFLINGASFISETTYYATLTTGTLVEMTVSGIEQHPYHIHVFPYQITSPTIDNYFQVVMSTKFTAA